MNKIVQIFCFIPTLFFWFFFLIYKKIFKKNRKDPRLVWGPTPLINNKYWSEALKKGGYDSTTFMHSFYSKINQREDFDLYFEDFFPFPKGHRSIAPFICFCYAITKFDIFHFSFLGGFLGGTMFWKMEKHLLKPLGSKIVVLGFGGDFYRYSKVMDISLRHALQLSYPHLAQQEHKIEKRVTFWQKHTDVLLNSMQFDGLGRWDILPVNTLAIDTELWQPRSSYSMNDGKNGVVNIIHTPNHRGFKGTEFIVHAVDELKQEGLNINLILVEGKKNSEVRRLMAEEADILVEQLIFVGYALSAIEGMASGLPVISNLENRDYVDILYRYSYLNECPILSSNPETIKDHLRLLVTNPSLRQELGQAGHKFVDKYNSPEASFTMFSTIYDKVWRGKDIDLMNFFHPVLKSSFNQTSPPVKHPLVRNKMPNENINTKVDIQTS